jgi:hypothetical protein
MPRIFNGISQKFLDALRSTLAISQRVDFCVDYLSLLGWQAIDDLISDWSSESGQICRVMVGMRRPPQNEIKALKMAALNAYRDAERGLIK